MKLMPSLPCLGIPGLHLVSCLWAIFALVWTTHQSAHAGNSNPDISAVGQILGGITTDPEVVNADNPTLQLGESELIFSAALNPYFQGMVQLAGDSEGIGVEEAYATWVQGLPWALGMKAGRYRLGFGKLNAMHPHVFPFIETPHAWQSLMPGAEEGLTEVSVQISQLLSIPGNGAATWSIDLFEGKSFHPGAEATRFGGLGHWGNAFSISDKWAFEIGASGAYGIATLNPDQAETLWGIDLKSKWYFSDMSQLTVHMEGCWRNSDATVLEDGSVGPSLSRHGFFAFANYQAQNHWNGGLMVEQWNPTENPDDNERAAKLFAGYSLLEESTCLRLSVERQFHVQTNDVHTVAIQLLFSMGPHKPHTF